MITPASATFVSEVTPATVKKSASTPVKVKPDLAVKVIVAVYTVEAANVASAGDQATVPVY